MTASVAEKKQGSKKRKARVLIVEDDTSLLFGLKKNLQFEGYEVFTASDGEAGLGMAVDERPDLIVLDVMLPRMNGFEVCEVLRGNEIETTSTVISSFHSIHSFIFSNQDMIRVQELECSLSEGIQPD